MYTAGQKSYSTMLKSGTPVSEVLGQSMDRYGLAGEVKFDGVDSANASIVERKAVALKDAIKQIQAVRKYLQMNSIEVKSNIQSGISRQMEALRSREVWLFNQADVVYQAKEEVLRKQEDGLNQALGALTNCLQLLDIGAAVEPDILNTINRVCELDTHPQETPHITFRADATALRDAIHRFGRVDAKGLPVDAFRTGDCDSARATSLPKQFEEYEDDEGEHQILYKTIDGFCDGSSSSSDRLTKNIVINIPQLPARSSDIRLAGLASRPSASPSTVAPQMAEVCHGATGGRRTVGLVRSLDNEKLSRGCNASSSVRQWLNDLNTEENEEDELMLSDSALVSQTSCQNAATTSLIVKSSEKPWSSEKSMSVAESSQSLENAESSGKLESESSHKPESSGKAESSAANEKFSFAFFYRILNRPFSDWLACKEASSSYRSNETESASLVYSNSTSSVSEGTKTMDVTESDGVKQADAVSNNDLSNATNPISGCVRRIYAYPSAYWLVTSRLVSPAIDRQSLSSQFVPLKNAPATVQFHFSVTFKWNPSITNTSMPPSSVESQPAQVHFTTYDSVVEGTEESNKCAMEDILRRESIWETPSTVGNEGRGKTTSSVDAVSNATPSLASLDNINSEGCGFGKFIQRLSMEPQDCWLLHSCKEEWEHEGKQDQDHFFGNLVENLLALPTEHWLARPKSDAFSGGLGSNTLEEDWVHMHA